MGNSKEWEAGEMSGKKLRNHSFQEKRGGSRCKVREEGVEVWFSPLSLKRLILCFQGCVCHFPLMCLYVIFTCVTFLFFSFVFSEKEKAQTLLKLFE